MQVRLGMKNLSLRRHYRVIAVTSMCPFSFVPFLHSRLRTIVTGVSVVILIFFLYFELNSLRWHARLFRPVGISLPQAVSHLSLSLPFSLFCSSFPKIQFLTPYPPYGGNAKGSHKRGPPRCLAQYRQASFQAWFEQATLYATFRRRKNSFLLQTSRSSPEKILASLLLRGFCFTFYVNLDDGARRDPFVS